MENLYALLFLIMFTLILLGIRYWLTRLLSSKNEWKDLKISYIIISFVLIPPILFKLGNLIYNNRDEWGYYIIRFAIFLLILWVVFLIYKFIILIFKMIIRFIKKTREEA